MKLCVITAQTKLWSHEDIARLAVRAGADCIQFRKKEGTSRELLDIALRIRKITREKATYVVDDRIDIALACNANGVHLGKEDIPLSVARKICPENFVIGSSVRSVREAIEAEKNGASYLGAGPIYSTANKPKEEPIRPETLKQICNSVSIPVIAIGGINRDTARETIEAGAAGIAVISAVADSKDPERSTKELLDILKTSRKE
jgi:thiamine-phosphate pyrophosphorylase